jgi:hypothetical protein
MSARSAALVAPNRSPPAYDATAIARHELAASPRLPGRRWSPRSRAETMRVAASGSASGPESATTAATSLGSDGSSSAVHTSPGQLGRSSVSRAATA